MWRNDAPSRFDAPANVRNAIQHSIRGLDPHHPVFDPQRCYMWTLWSSLQLRDTDTHGLDIYLKTPLTHGKSGLTQSLRSLLYYHHRGQELDPPVTSSSAICPCRSGLRYGACCFPTIRTVCDRFTGVRSCGLCVNPHHFAAGKACDHHESQHAPCCEFVLFPTEPCEPCQFDPQLFVVSDRVSGRHPGPTEILTFRTAAEVNPLLLAWKTAGTESLLKEKWSM